MLIKKFKRTGSSESPWSIEKVHCASVNGTVRMSHQKIDDIKEISGSHFGFFLELFWLFLELFRPLLSDLLGYQLDEMTRNSRIE